MIKHEWEKINYWAPCYQTRLRATLDKSPRIKSLGTNLKQIEPWIGPFFTLKKHFFAMIQWACLRTMGPIQGSNIKNVWLTCERIVLTVGLFFLFLPFFHDFFFFFFFFYSYYTQWIFFLTFSPFSFITTTFFLGALLFEMEINLKLFYKSKSPSHYENWHFNPSLFAASFNSTPFHTLGKAKNALLTTTLWRFTNPTMSTLKLIKNVTISVLSTMSSIHNMFFIFTKLEQQGLKKINFIFTKFEQQVLKKTIKKQTNKKMSNLGP